MPSNGFENALVLHFKLFLLVNFRIPLHLFDLGFECISWLWEAWHEVPPFISRNHFLMELVHTHTLDLIYIPWF